ncbi:MAG: dTMP kinase [Candidatus Nealsonbacteria bacterium]
MEKNTFPGKFIVFEGLDGSGQSTQSGLLKDFLLKKGYNILLAKEPTLDSEAGRKIRKVLRKELKIPPQELQELFVQDRKEHLEKTIIPALKQGKTVISDRYFLSSLAYGTSEGLDLEWLIEINSQFLFPDIIFLLKVNPETCIKRAKKRNIKITLFEEKEKLAMVWQTYEILPARFENIYVIDGEKSIEKVFEQIKNILNKKLNL